MVDLIACSFCQKKNFRIVFRTHGRRIVRCLNDGLVMVNPLPSQNQLKKLYGADYFQNRDPYLRAKDVHRRYFQQKINQIEAKTTNRGRLLDVGCGWGFLLAEAQKRGWAALGIDVSRSALAFCRRQGLAVKQGSLLSAKLPASSFAVVASLQTIEHETNPLTHLKQIYRLLKPGGWLVLTTPNYDSWTRILMANNWFGYRHLEHLYFFTPPVLKKMLVKAGFQRIDIKRDNVRIFTLGYYLSRLADFYLQKFVKWVADVLKRIVGNLPAPIPTDPWGDILVLAQK